MGQQRRTSTDTPSPHYRLLGIGAGPANLSLAALLHEEPTIPHLFLDKKQHFTWHDEQLLAGATLQVSIFKDLVSLSNPTNRFSFLSYLHAHGRMYHFLNAQFSEVPRAEFRNYLQWAADTNEDVVFGEEVKEVDFDGMFRVRTNRRTLSAENIAIGVGTVPKVPDFVEPHLGPDHFHVSQYLRHCDQLAGRKVAVVGGGQSGAEAFLDLVNRRGPAAPEQVAWVSRRRNYFPIDDSTFTNEFFMPHYSDYFFRLPAPVREQVSTSHLLASDGISESTLKAIYQKLYHLQFIDENRRGFGLFPNRTVLGVDGANGRGWELMIGHNDEPDQTQSLTVDAVVWATGFRSAPKGFLAPLRGRWETENGEFKVDEDFAAVWDGPPDRSIFVQNAVRGQRGLPDVNLSLNAWRAQRIVDRLHGRAGMESAVSFVDWSAKAGSDSPWSM
ncbi:lysine N(6)-hydroxylase/L-ornithine N(5)-oxygenase family protein [Natronoglycomyces albus]|uniref:L-lysine N6-monooxygenase MbtG n=1 Tax=Natronoglycomyces albus TaxID=2811108 RepID=A0A895XZ51_9ACTN|nr:SidA/IucD/PvdA family monooxygenase [Natronoglycomyces albus]QSB06878.1 SidA/IucD/PvdA family monooxygenase [Natronoglycomyces albus]